MIRVLLDRRGVDRHDRRDSKSLQVGETPTLPANSFKIK